MANILDQIIANKRVEVEALKSTPFADFSVSARTRPSMAKALLSSPTGIIAEFKRRSPSKGEIHAKALVTDIVPSYERNGASACSVLTDTPYFGGALTDLMAAARCSSLPLLRKEFIIDEIQIRQAAAAGASAVLLIAAALDAEQIATFTARAHALGLEVLLEMHSVDELDKFCPAVDMVGVNNRNLSTFEVDPLLGLKLAERLPSGVVKVAESGLTSITEVKRLRDAGYRGFLIGETLMKHNDPGLALKQFIDGTL